MTKSVPYVMNKTGNFCMLQYAFDKYVNLKKTIQK